jgi:uncharacterized membrane protein HdeD (DUF308 family)
MFLIWGSRGAVVDLGQVQTALCPVCERERSFHLIVQYRYFHLYFIFGAITQKVYWLACAVCHRGTTLSAATAEQHLSKNPIPFMHRSGLLALVGGAVMLIGTMIGAQALLALLGAMN